MTVQGRGQFGRQVERQGGVADLHAEVDGDKHQHALVFEYTKNRAVAAAAFLLFLGFDDGVHGVLLFGAEPFGIAGTARQIEERNHPDHRGGQAFNHEHPLPVGQTERVVGIEDKAR